MEKAILKTLIYADLFNYPLKTYELHKWLIGKKVALRQVEKALKKLVKNKKIKVQQDYYFLPKKKTLVSIRKRKEKQSKIYLRKAEILSRILKIIPWIKLVGISGGLAMENAGKKDDIDLFIITQKNRLWVSRLTTILLLSLIGQRRKAGDSGRKIAGKICINTLLAEDKLEQENKDIFVAHEVLQLRVLWQRGSIYRKFLEDNTWAFDFLPNWVTIHNFNLKIKMPNQKNADETNYRINDFLESLTKWLQLKIMKEPLGLERIGDGFLYFHPEDCRPKILSAYKKRIKR